MKVSIVVPVPEKDENFEEFSRKLKAFKEMGYDGVELAIRNPKEIEGKKIRVLMNRLGLKIVGITTGQAFSKDGLSFIDPDENVRRRAVARIKNQISFAALFRAKVLIGWIRGNWQKCGDILYAVIWFLEAMKECNDFARKRGVQLVLEPINRYEIDFIHRVDQAIDLIRGAELDNVGICIDTFHMNIEEGWIASAITDVGEAGLLSHVHIADNNREAPGRGRLDFREILFAISDVGYDGFVSVEVFPKGDFMESAGEAVEEIRRITG